MAALHFFCRATSILYGLIGLGTFALLALCDGSFFTKPSKEEQDALRRAQELYWDLSKPALGSLQHCFYTLRDGLKLHYVQTSPGAKTPPSNLVIFIHGFPDSWLLWKKVLLSPNLPNDAQYIAVDLPGYGGSDSFPNYGPELTMEAITDFILGMRAAFDITDEQKVTIVSHDWGSVIAFRLASEAPQIANRFIITSIVLPALSISNTINAWSSFTKMLRTYTRHPTSFGMLRHAFSTIQPVLSQLAKIAYIFVFNLPMPLASFSGTMANSWFLRTVQRTGYTHPSVYKRANSMPSLRYHPLPLDLTTESMVSILGPGITQCASTSTSSSSETPATYPPSVIDRAQSFTNSWQQKISYYRDGLFSAEPWPKSLDTLAALSNLSGRHASSAARDALFASTAPEGAVRAPTTVILAEEDRVFDIPFNGKGMSDYLVTPSSQFIILKETTHWLPIQEEGVAAILTCLRWVITPEGEASKASLKSWLGDGAKVLVDK